MCWTQSQKRGSVLSMMPHQGERPRWGEFEDLGRVEGAQQHRMELWLHTGLCEHTWRNKKCTNSALVFLFFCIKKINKLLKTPKTKEEEKAEAKKEKLPEEKLQATSIKDQVTPKPLI